LRRERSLDEGESKQLLDGIVAEYSLAPSDLFDRNVLLERLEQALNRLPPAYKQVILWRSRDRWPFARIGAKMDRSADAARMLWYRAIRLLKKEMGVNDGDH
jgi:DNA-directed RNA polymerase specialized sigma24 family protein